VNRVLRKYGRQSADRTAAMMARGFMVPAGGGVVRICNAAMIEVLQRAIADMLRSGRSEIVRPVTLEAASGFPGFAPHSNWSDRVWLAVVLDDNGMPYAAVQQEGSSSIPPQCRVGVARSAALFTAWRNSLSPSAKLVNLPPAGRA
jgi:hypothetical protein